jgi:hypothetical protein
LCVTQEGEKNNLPRDNDASPEHSPRRILVVELLLDWCAVTLAEPHHGLGFIRLGQIRDSDALDIQPAELSLLRWHHAR